MAVRARTEALADHQARPSPTDQELVTFITKPMRSVDVAAHFEMDGPVCLRRLARLVKNGKLSRPFFGFYAPLGVAVERPHPPLHAKVLGCLGKPRTAIEISALIGVGYSVTRILQTLMRYGHVVHHGHLNYVRADVAGQFGAPPPRRKRQDGRTPRELREAMLCDLVEPRSVSYLAVALGETRERITGLLIRMEQAGMVVRLGKMGKPSVLHFVIADPPALRRASSRRGRPAASGSRARP